MSKLTAVVTGGSRGIGKAIALKFLKEGVSVIINARKQEGIDKLVEEAEKAGFKGMIKGYASDLSQKPGVTAFAKWMETHNLRPDILVNNAGYYLPGGVLTEEDGAFEAMMSANVASAYHLTRALVPVLKEKPRAHIFNLCSIASITAYTNGGSYCISKFAMLGMNKVLREELKETKVAVTALLPGATLTDSWAGSDLPEDRFIRSEDLAELIWHSWLISDRSVVEEILVRPLKGDI